MNGHFIIAQVIRAAVLGIKEAEYADKSPRQYLEILDNLANELSKPVEKHHVSGGDWPSFVMRHNPNAQDGRHIAIATQSKKDAERLFDFICDFVDRKPELGKYARRVIKGPLHGFPDGKKLSDE